MCERVYAFLQKLARTMVGKRVLVVSHDGTIWCFRYVLERWTYAETKRRLVDGFLLVRNGRQMAAFDLRPR